jgi:hypothetical protein
VLRQIAERGPEQDLDGSSWPWRATQRARRSPPGDTLAKDRLVPGITAQVLFYPVGAAASETPCYPQFATGYQPRRDAMPVVLLRIRMSEIARGVGRSASRRSGRATISSPGSRRRFSSLPRPTCCAARATLTRRSFGSLPSRSQLFGTPRSVTISWSSTTLRRTETAIAASTNAPAIAGAGRPLTRLASQARRKHAPPTLQPRGAAICRRTQ